MTQAPAKKRLPIRQAIERIAWPGQEAPRPATSLEALKIALTMSEPAARLLEELRSGKISAYGERLRLPPKYRPAPSGNSSHNYFRSYEKLVSLDVVRRKRHEPAKPRKIPAKAWENVATSWIGDQFLASNGIIYRNVEVPESKIAARWPTGVRAPGRPEDSAEINERKYGALAQRATELLPEQEFSVKRATYQACREAGYDSAAHLERFRRYFNNR